MFHFFHPSTISLILPFFINNIHFTIIFHRMLSSSHHHYPNYPNHHHFTIVLITGHHILYPHYSLHHHFSTVSPSHSPPNHHHYDFPPSLTIKSPSSSLYTIPLRRSWHHSHNSDTPSLVTTHHTQRQVEEVFIMKINFGFIVIANIR